MWLNISISELRIIIIKIIDYFSGPIKMRCDNKAAIDFSKYRLKKGQTKHIDIAYHVVREKD